MQFSSECATWLKSFLPELGSAKSEQQLTSAGKRNLHVRVLALLKAIGSETGQLQVGDTLLLRSDDPKESAFRDE